MQTTPIAWISTAGSGCSDEIDRIPYMGRMADSWEIQLVKGDCKTTATQHGSTKRRNCLAKGFAA